MTITLTARLEQSSIEELRQNREQAIALREAFLIFGTEPGNNTKYSSLLSLMNETNKISIACATEHSYDNLETSEVYRNIVMTVKTVFRKNNIIYISDGLFIINLSYIIQQLLIECIEYKEK